MGFLFGCVNIAETIRIFVNPTITIMRNLFILLTIVLACTACKKDDEIGTLKHKLEFKTAPTSRNTLSDSVYTQFGQYITSVTPDVFTAKLNFLFYKDAWGSADEVMFSYVDGQNGAQGVEISVFVDFSNNQILEIEPIIYQKEMLPEIINLVYFTFGPYYLYQEFNLPAEYDTITLNQFNAYYQEFLGMGQGGSQYYCDSVKFGTLVKTRYAPLIVPIWGQQYPSLVLFGNTDSTFIFNEDHNEVQTGPDYPIAPGNESVIRSHKFTSQEVVMPVNDEVKTMHSVMSFDTQNLIQIYAGADNIPYTSDDIIVYAPNYWERINVSLSVE